MIKPRSSTQSASTDAASTLPTIITRPTHCFIHTTSHSKWRWHSSMRGGFTRVEGSAVRPAFSSSFTPGAKVRPRMHAFSSCARSNFARLTTNCPVSRMLR